MENELAVPLTKLERAAHDDRVLDIVVQLVTAMHLPVWPASIEIHFSQDGTVQKVEAHVVPWRRAGKA